MAFTSETTVTTENASKYLQQLCKHFGHKVETSFTPEEGKINFPMAVCILEAKDNTLFMRLSAETQEDVRKAEGIVVSHLERFAFKEDLSISWS
ncbi:DUF2218 domain-containing protein [uncultured Cohaesibacter sp.]|uniref:DUF2218 domain-containing protein n=1 Tax=uncultured Cohaesibacter sp. TaxID=1002546 RepID=UPI00292ED26A|nr:DUF2218 domain-containing protein [uncultured Cohaesibacter sp.]